jgi:hypothetical protein
MGKFLTDNAGGFVDPFDESAAASGVEDGTRLVAAGELLAAVAGRGKSIDLTSDWRSSGRSGASSSWLGGKKLLAVAKEVEFPVYIHLINPVRKRQMGQAAPFFEDVLDVFEQVIVEHTAQTIISPASDARPVWPRTVFVGAIAAAMNRTYVFFWACWKQPGPDLLDLLPREKAGIKEEMVVGPTGFVKFSHAEVSFAAKKLSAG